MFFSHGPTPEGALLCISAVSMLFVLGDISEPFLMLHPEGHAWGWLVGTLPRMSEDRQASVAHAIDVRSRRDWLYYAGSHSEPKMTSQDIHKNESLPELGPSFPIIRKGPELITEHLPKNLLLGSDDRPNTRRRECAIHEVYTMAAVGSAAKMSLAYIKHTCPTHE